MLEAEVPIALEELGSTDGLARAVEHAEQRLRQRARLEGFVAPADGFVKFSAVIKAAIEVRPRMVS